MNPRWSRLSLGSFFLISAVVFSAPGRAATITLRADEWYPYNGNPKRGNVGYMIEIAEAAAKRMGHSIDYAVMDWDAAKVQTLAGKFDCLVGATRPDGPGYNFTNEPIGYSISSIFALKNKKLKFTTVGQLAGKRVGIVKDYSYGAEIDAFIIQNKANMRAITHSRPVVINMLRLIKGEVDVVLEDRNVGNTFISVLGIENSVVNAGDVSSPDPLYIACSPKSNLGQQFVNEVSNQVRQMRQSGELAKLMQKYGLKDWAGTR